MAERAVADDGCAETYAEFIAPGLDVRFHEARYSMRELAELIELIELGTWRDEPVPPGEWPPPENPLGITELAVDPRLNRVVVGIYRWSQAAADELVRRYGPMIDVIHSPPMPLL